MIETFKGQDLFNVLPALWTLSTYMNIDNLCMFLVNSIMTDRLNCKDISIVSAHPTHISFTNKQHFLRVFPKEVVDNLVYS